MSLATDCIPLTPLTPLTCPTTSPVAVVNGKERCPSVVSIKPEEGRKSRCWKAGGGGKEGVMVRCRDVNGWETSGEDVGRKEEVRGKM